MWISAVLTGEVLAEGSISAIAIDRGSARNAGRRTRSPRLDKSLLPQARPSRLAMGRIRAVGRLALAAVVAATFAPAGSGSPGNMRGERPKSPPDGSGAGSARLMVVRWVMVDAMADQHRRVQGCYRDRPPTRGRGRSMYPEARNRVYRARESGSAGMSFRLQ